MLPESSDPYYKRLANFLIQEIEGGKYAVGASLPTERELCESFGVSRHTTREALRRLENSGLIIRRQGSGSTVVAVTPPVKYEQNIQTIDDLLQHGNATRLQVLSCEDVALDKNQFASQVGHIAQTPCIQVRSIRYARNDVRPLALVDVYVAVRAKIQARKLLNRDTAALEIVNTVDIRKIDRIEQAFSAVVVAEAEAKLLHVKSGDAAFQIVRHYYDSAGRLLVLAHSLYHGTLFNYASTLRRS